MKIILWSIISLLLTMQAVGQCLKSEQEFKDYFLKNIETLDPIEGIWSVDKFAKYYDKDNTLITYYNYTQIAKVAIIKNASDFEYCVIEGADRGNSVYFTKTATTGVYLYRRISPDGDVAKTTAVLSSGLLQYKYKIHNLLSPELYHTEELKCIKLFPTSADVSKSASGSGTGFAISSNGNIATNHHVIDGATSIKVRGINGDFSKVYKAKLIVDDKNNDLAIIQVADSGFNSLGSIPYVIANKTDDVGSSVFCLGYPLRSTMGEEVKLTNGIISSKSGFQGDITTYQISAPIQPGNSGGPLFDDKGNLIGITNAHHLGAENVSYAIKTSYLLNLIDIIPTTPKLQTVSLLTGKPLPEQVKLIKDFTYIIEVN